VLQLFSSCPFSTDFWSVVAVSFVCVALAEYVFEVEKRCERLRWFVQFVSVVHWLYPTVAPASYFHATWPRFARYLGRTSFLAR